MYFPHILDERADLTELLADITSTKSLTYRFVGWPGDKIVF